MWSCPSRSIRLRRCDADLAAAETLGDTGRKIVGDFCHHIAVKVHAFDLLLGLRKDSSLLFLCRGLIALASRLATRRGLVDPDAEIDVAMKSHVGSPSA